MYTVLQATSLVRWQWQVSRNVPLCRVRCRTPSMSRRGVALWCGVCSVCGLVCGVVCRICCAVLCCAVLCSVLCALCSVLLCGVLLAIYICISLGLPSSPRPHDLKPTRPAPLSPPGTCTALRRICHILPSCGMQGPN